MPGPISAGWGCEACLGFNPPTVARCETCGVQDPAQVRAIEERERAAREEEVQRIKQLDREARKRLARFGVGNKARVFSALAAQDGFAELERRVRADAKAAPLP